MNKSTRKNNAAALATSEWYQQFVRFVELRDIAPRTRVCVDDFLKRWLTHVLPKGFVRVRHHGWMSGTARITRLLARAPVCGQLDENPIPFSPRRQSRAARIAARK